MTSDRSNDAARWLLNSLVVTNAMVPGKPVQPLAPGATLGVLGGGQLGRMFSQAASKMGYKVCVLDPAVDSPAAEVSAFHVEADFDDEAGLAKLADVCDAVTTEFENVPADSLRFLKDKIPVYPPPEAVEIAQNRNREKAFFKQHGLPVNTCASITAAEHIEPAFDLMGGRAVIKTARFGYDGKGQKVCQSADDVYTAFATFGGVECVLEDFVPFDCEVSVVLARDIYGNVETFPVVENRHKDGILDVCIVPANVSDEVQQHAIAAAVLLAGAMNYVGVLAVEMFVCDGAISLNEIAPRPHNSGHYTMDACNYSQFDQQVRSLAGLSVAKVVQHQPVVMVNVLGDLLVSGEFDWQKLQSAENTHVHVYGCLLYTSPSPRDGLLSRMPSSA